MHLDVALTNTLVADKQGDFAANLDLEMVRTVIDLRYGVHPSGRAVLPFMNFTDLSDEDLTAIVSYLRSRPPIDHTVPANDYNLKGRVAKAFVINPRGPTKPIRARVTVGATVEYGEYVANAVANCGGCHTKRKMRTGEVEGASYAGGATLASRTSAGTTFVPPNLTPDPATGRIYAWSEDMFVARFKNAVLSSGSGPAPGPGWRC